MLVSVYVVTMMSGTKTVGYMAAITLVVPAVLFVGHIAGVVDVIALFHESRELFGR